MIFLKVIGDGDEFFGFDVFVFDYDTFWSASVVFNRRVVIKY